MVFPSKPRGAAHAASRSKARSALAYGPTCRRNAMRRVGCRTIRGEKSAGTRKNEVNVGGRITVPDNMGAFGNPTSDSARTMVTPATSELLVIVYAPAETPPRQLDHVLAVTAERLASTTGGSRA